MHIMLCLRSAIYSYNSTKTEFSTIKELIYKAHYSALPEPEIMVQNCPDKLVSEVFRHFERWVDIIIYTNNTFSILLHLQMPSKCMQWKPKPISYLISLVSNLSWYDVRYKFKFTCIDIASWMVRSEQSDGCSDIC